MTLFVLARLARAEGTDEFGATQMLSSTTYVFVDILDFTSEDITWEGDFEINVYYPSGAVYDTYNPGDTFSVTEDGAWIISPTGDEDDWDIEVDGRDPDYGRIWSYAWQIDAGSFDEEDSFNSSFYTIVNGGGTGYDGVVEMETDGFAGYIYELEANSAGAEGANGRSVSEEDTYNVPEYPIYLNPPETASYNWGDPSVSAESWSAGLTGCDEVVYGYVDGEFNFTATLEGTYHIVCDLNNDGEYDITSDDDLQLLGDATSGSNTVTWDGTDNGGDPVDPGEYSCQIILTVGEFHYVARDVETSYSGFRLFSVDSSLDRDGLLMFWNDTEVQDNEEETMPNGEWSSESSGADGLDSGTYGAAVNPNENARSWGDFDDDTKGNEAYLDTYTWLDHDTSDEFTITVADWELDSDRDGLIDAEEYCTYATDEFDPDTDGDGLGDYEEAKELPTDPLDPDSDADGIEDGEECDDADDCDDTDNDGDIDAVDPDDDGDGIATADEDVDGDGEWDDDTDDDGDPNYLDPDDDGDLVPTEDEGTDGDDDPSDDDWDDDGTPNHLDEDDDGDGVDTADEDIDGDGDPETDDTDGDGTSNWLDVDDDGDGIASIDEDTDGDGDPSNDDIDADGTPNYLDLDTDGDGISDEVEGAGDTDGDGDGDFADTDADDDSIPDSTEGTVDSDNDGIEDFHDTDDDGDGIDTIEEVGSADTDKDGADDYLDEDDDGDGISTSTEGGFDTDTDADGTSDHQDLDSDGDGILDETETNRDTDGDTVGDWRDTDSDGDSLLDADEGEGDSDTDGLGDWVDDDDDGDTVPTIDEAGVDTDGDGSDDHLDPDDDGDGIPTEHENRDTWEDDVDGDGTNNWRDTDADGDGIDDEQEGTEDEDGDKMPNYLDPDGTYDTYYKGGGCGCDATSGAGALPALLAFFAARRRRS